ncbi:MAG: hypothetical protein LUQ32_01935 [Methanomicrobiales archaeon]|nr:hypothetical protein [Methanomicrobiales archaeon]
MHKIVRQMILGFGTFGTGTALLYLSVNPYLLVLTDTVVGVGMLFAAGSLTVDDLHLRRTGVPGGGAVTGAESVPADGTEGSHGLLASLGKVRGSLKPAIRGKEEKETRTKEIDKALDKALTGQSGRLISIAEGKRPAPGSAAMAVETAQHGEDLLQELSGAGIPTPFLDDEETEEEAGAPQSGAAGPGVPGREAVRPANLLGPEEAKEEAQVNVLSLADEGLGADDLLSALRLEAMREKRKDDTSLLRDLKGVKVTGRQLLEELDSLVREIRGR